MPNRLETLRPIPDRILWPWWTGLWYSLPEESGTTRRSCPRYDDTIKLPPCRGEISYSLMERIQMKGRRFSLTAHLNWCYVVAQVSTEVQRHVSVRALMGQIGPEPGWTIWRHSQHTDGLQKDKYNLIKTNWSSTIIRIRSISQNCRKKSPVLVPSSKGWKNLWRWDRHCTQNH